jgi:hypothetical protein
MFWKGLNKDKDFLMIYFYSGFLVCRSENFLISVLVWMVFVRCLAGWGRLGGGDKLFFVLG